MFCSKSFEHIAGKGLDIEYDTFGEKITYWVTWFKRMDILCMISVMKKGLKKGIDCLD